MLWTSFLESDVNRVLSDEGYRLLIMLLAEKRRPDDTDVCLPWSQIKEQTGWHWRKIGRAIDELVALRLIRKLDRSAIREAQVYRLNTDTKDGDRFDEMLRKGEITPTKNDNKLNSRAYQVDSATGHFAGSKGKGKRR